MIYDLIYAVMAIACALTLGGDRSRKAIFYLCLAGLFVFVAFRFRIGCDWRNYLGHYEQQSPFLQFDEVLTRSEPGYWLLVFELVRLDLPYVYLNIAAAAVFFLLIRSLSCRLAPAWINPVLVCG